MKFIADSMLGRLARWLRLLGYDTLYYPHIENSQLLRFVREGNRILLTRNTRLVKVRGLGNFLLLEDNDPFHQLSVVIREFNLGLNIRSGESGQPLILSRCSICNAGISDVPKHEVKALVPGYVYKTCDVFKQCSGCGKLYWKGTHPDKLREKLSEVLHPD